MTDTSFDIVIIGAGQAAVPLSKALAGKGRTTALIEAEHLGGSCINFGCTPTKAVIASARVAHLARRGREFGIGIADVQPQFDAVLARARRIVEQSVASLEESLAHEANPRLIRGRARLCGREGDRFVVSVGDERLTASQVVLDTGTTTRVPDIEGLDGIDYLCAENWLHRPGLPEHLLIVGASYIGLEMGQFYRRMGSQVTIVGPGKRIADHEDEDVARELQKLLEREGIGFRLQTSARSVSKTDAGLSLACEGASGNPQRLAGTHLFLATGRQPATAELGLETVGVRLSKKGTVEVDERLASSVAGVWAAGDIRGGPMFTHTAWDDYRILQSQLIGDGSRTTDRVVPYALFTDPELGRSGLTEDEARARGHRFRTVRFDMKHNGKAREVGETDGFIKVLIDDDSQQILGAAVLANEGAELVHIYVALMNAKAPYTVLENAIQIHPTLAEAVQSAVTGS
jgi:pyruvate/2-oxoglutarate dehydrogenase complex dihydrolipoamide dehydrogenase (E3) component